MASYAALLSLSHILNQILHPPPNHHFIFPREQMESLRERVSFLIDFFENYSTRRSQEIDELEKRIADAAYEAEDIIESDVVSQLQAKMETSALFYIRKGIRILFLPIQKVLKKKNIQEVTKKFISIEKELLMIKSIKGMEDRRPEKSTGGAISSSRPLPGGKNIMVGFDEHLNQIRSALATDASSLQIIPVVGMGGIGKTTLATNVYEDPYIVEHFEFHAWVTVSQEYTEREIVLALLHQINSNIDPRGQGRSADKLGNMLHKELFGRRYFIILDDMWDIDAWDRLKVFLPDNGNGSRVLVTTRQGKLAKDIASCNPYEVRLLDKENSWNLILQKVFVEEVCPPDLEGIGRSIAEKCSGLPLALIVIGGLLANSEKTREFWEYVEQDVTSAANDENDEHCLKILSLSYSHLPVHLKPCFLYLAMFPKNVEIRVSRLIRLWVAEGFIKSAGGGKSLEEVGENYLKDLFDRNLIMGGKLGSSGKAKTYSIHDLLRDLCYREARKGKFLRIIKLDNPKTSPHMDGDKTSSHKKCERRLSIHAAARKKKVRKALRSATLDRSLLSYSSLESKRSIARRLNLLRVLDVVDSYSMDEILQLINSRYIACSISLNLHSVPSLITLLWNLQTLVLPGFVSLPSEIWQMKQLRHLKMRRITLPDPPDTPMDSENIMVLENLQTLSTVEDFIFKEQVLQRIPNLKKLGIHCATTEEIRSFCLTNLFSLHKLESLALAFIGSWENIPFPVSLKKLTLSYCQIPWEDMSMVGSLPSLEVLKLQTDAVKGRHWNPNAGGFDRLKFLLIDSCELETWEADDSHYPNLEQLYLKRLRLNEIPMDFAHITTLKLIDLNYCSSSLFTSAKEMSKERENLGFEDIQVRSFPEAPVLRKDNVVGLEDEAEKLIGYLSEETEQLDVISIIGMPGLGKTTLAGKIFNDPEIKYQFPTRIWIYVSQDFTMKQIFLAILSQLVRFGEDISWDDADEVLAEFVASQWAYRKFLLVMDDVWTTQDWDKLQIALPKGNKSSKVLITSRQVEVGRYVNRFRDPHMLRFLTFEESRFLLGLEVFGKPDFPPELGRVGSLIAKQCDGLPLAIVVIGGILAKVSSPSDDMTATKNAWTKVCESVNTYIIEDSGRRLEKIISLSYEKLPHYLRDCFLYFGLFPEDYEIPVWKLIRLWIAEGFIQEKDDISPEETAENYLGDLINRNLVGADKFKSNGKIKTCRIHDMLRVFCKTKAGDERNNFFQEFRKSGDGGFQPPVLEVQNCHRLCIHSNVLNFLFERPYGPSVLSFVCFSQDEIHLQREHVSAITEGFKLLRVLDVKPIKFTIIPSDMYQLLHLRYIALSCNSEILPPTFSKLLSIQTLIVDTTSQTLEIKADIMKMIQLRHLKTNASTTLTKPDKSSKGGEKIQTLGTISPESCTEEFFDRARNLKKLGIRGPLALLLEGKKGSFDSLQKLENLEKLKLINDARPPSDGLPPAYMFPTKLRRLTLYFTFLDWRQMSVLGSLENLEVLKLKEDAFRGTSWEVTDGGFRHLEILHIERTDLSIWVASQHQFPRLKCVMLRSCYELQEIPLGLADIPNFQTLDLFHCEFAVASAKKIHEAKKKHEDQQSGNLHCFKLSIFPPEK